MKAKFLKNLLVTINALTLLFQMTLMGSLGHHFDFPLLSLLVPLICLVNLAFFIYWLIKLQWPFLLFIGGILIGISEWGLLYQPPNNAIFTTKGLKVMSFNVRLFNSYEWIKNKDIPAAIDDFITTEAPDIICFQEYESTLAPELTAYPYRYFQPTLINGSFGLAIFSKRPLYNLGKINFEDSSNGGIYADFLHKKDTLRVFNVHFESLRINLRDTLITNQSSKKLKNRIEKVIDKQNEQVAVFKRSAAEVSHPSIVCTDLNNNAFSKIYRTLTTDRKDAFVSAGNGIGTTFRFAYFPLRIDFIFVDPTIKVYSFTTHSVGYSDHEPVVAEIDWP